MNIRLIFISVLGASSMLWANFVFSDILSCRYVLALKIEEGTCREELRTERRPKLNPNNGCARLIDEMERFNQAYRDGLIEFNDSCRKQEVIEVGADAAEVLNRARAKGWTTFEDYLKYYNKSS